jgi:hypothetical protein
VETPSGGLDLNLSGPGQIDVVPKILERAQQALGESALKLLPIRLATTDDAKLGTTSPNRVAQDTRQLEATVMGGPGLKSDSISAPVLPYPRTVRQAACCRNRAFHGVPANTESFL